MIYIFEDQQVLDLEPLTINSASFELRCGAFTHLERIRSIAGNQPISLIVRPELIGVAQERYPDLLINPERAEAGLWLNGAALWNKTALKTLQTESSPITRDGRLVGASYNADEGEQFRSYLLNDEVQSFTSPDPKSPKLMCHLWDHILTNPEQITTDFHERYQHEANTKVPNGVHLIGDGGVYFGQDVTIDPAVVLDTRTGPVIIENGNVIGSHSVIKGPCYIGPECYVKPFSLLEEVSLGPMCSVMGQLTNVIIQSYSNKQHYGFLGHSYLGSWINLGAGTSNSNLKINYNKVKVEVNGRLVNTGQIFVGCFIGDYTKTAIGTLLSTGSRIGIAANIFNNASPPKVVPSFSWGGNDGEFCELSKCLNSIEIAKGRRKLELTDAERNLLSELYEKKVT